MTPTRRSWPVRVALTTAVLAVVAGLGLGPAAAEGDRAGSVTVVAPDGGTLERGGSSTPFTLELPAGAACPGDSANDDYRIQSFIVPDDVDPGGLTYESTKPAGEGLWALYAVSSEPYVQGLTSIAASPGDPGVIDQLPAFDFAVFPPGTLAEGDHHVGIACTLYNETVRYWDTDMVLTDTPADEPAQLSWVAPAAPAASSSSSSVLPWVAVGAGLVVLVGAAFVLRHRNPTGSAAPERS